MKIEYHRKPTIAEIKFGYGATHYLDIDIDVARKKDGSLKKWVKIGNLRYYR